METLVCHGHSLTPSSSGIAFRCFWCKTGGYILNGYHCFECDRWFHKDCGIRWLHKDCHNPDCPICSLIRHTSHPQHFLRKIELYFNTRFWCRKCRRHIDDRSFYHCSICDIKLPQAHEHPLVLVSRNLRHHCKACKDVDVLPVECVNLTEVNHPCHPKHSVKLLTSRAPDYTDDTCLVCGFELDYVLYHCSICNFSVCLGCTTIPPHIHVEHLKTHVHKLTLMARQISFTCNACGMQGNYSPYVCLQCDFMVHRSCIGLPRVININCHDHCISHTQQLSFGNWVCKICLKSVNRFYGAYICSVCSNYVVHSQCATKNDVWDGVELEGIPEEAEDTTPFKDVGDNLIYHFSHEEHNLKLNKDGTTHGGSIRCEACILPVYSDPVYSCEQCAFILHEICAKLPRKKLHMFHNKPLTLNVGDDGTTSHSHYLHSKPPTLHACSACGDYFSGFRYESDNVVLDVRCILIPELLFREKHEHPSLHYNKTYIGECDACHRYVESGAISCLSCNYNLDFWCASLPKTVEHICDHHPLSLSCHENASGKYWCDICEEKLDPKKWFYACNDYCQVSLHVKCVLGDFSRLKQERKLLILGLNVVVIPNNHSSRPICTICRLRCQAPFILWTCFEREFICSERCLIVHWNFLGKSL